MAQRNERQPWLKRAGCFAALGLVTLLCGCSTQQGVSSASTDQVAELKRQLLDMERESRVSEVEIARLRQQIDRLKGELEETRARRAVANPPNSQSPAREPFPDSEARDSSTEPVTLTAAPEASEIEVSDIDEVDLLPPPSEVALQREVPEQVAELDPVGADAQELYDQAYTLFHQENYAEAERMFQRFLERYPTTDLSDNALFWIGESRYARGEYDAALSSFYEAVERFPTGNKVADAMLKAGKCLENLQDPQRARETYQEMIERFPESVAATMARERLALLP